MICFCALFPKTEGEGISIVSVMHLILKQYATG